jgi:hypothetical protein
MLVRIAGIAAMPTALALLLRDSSFTELGRLSLLIPMHLLFPPVPQNEPDFPRGNFSIDFGRRVKSRWIFRSENAPTNRLPLKWQARK